MAVAPRGPFTRWVARLRTACERGFVSMRDGYVGLLTRLLRRRNVVPIVAAIVLALGATMFVFVGRDLFPAFDGGQIQLCVRGKLELGQRRITHPPGAGRNCRRRAIR